MKKFWRYIYRSSLKNIGALFGAACIISLGIFVYIAMKDILVNLSGQIEAYYQTNQMADVFASVDGISSKEIEKLTEIPGIAKASGKMAVNARLLMDGQQQMVTLHLLSYDPEDTVNKISISNKYLNRNGIYLGKRMIDANGYKEGMGFKILFNSKSYSSSLNGTCFAPNYIYTVPASGSIFPDGAIYDIACVDRRTMENWVGKKDSYQEVGIRLKPGYQLNDVRPQLIEYLTGCGLSDIRGKNDQSSYAMVDKQVRQLKAIGTILPVIFLAVSIFMLYIILKKMIVKDQSIIGTMKALGMTDRELISAYMMQGGGVGITGAVIGALIAAPFGRFMFTLFISLFSLPDSNYHILPGSRVQGLIIAMVTSIAAVYLGVRGVVEIMPAQAMRAKSPESTYQLRLPQNLMKVLGPMKRMGLRSVTRNPFRGFLIVLAIGFPFSMASVLFSFRQFTEQMYYQQFNLAQTYDMQLTLSHSVSQKEASEAGMEMKGVMESEGVMQLNVKLQNDNLTEFAKLYGLNRHSDMWRIVDIYGHFYEPPDDGLILNSHTAHKLHIKKGDVLEVTCPGITVEKVKIPVKEIIVENFGSSSYISRTGFETYLHGSSMSNTVLIHGKSKYLDNIKKRILNTRQVVWLVDTGRILDSYREQMKSTMTMINVFAFLSVIAGGILIYNISMINIRERITELGTLRLMGNSEGEIAGILAFEQLIYFVSGIMMGIPGSLAVRTLVETILKTDTYTIILFTQIDAYLKAFGICLLITALSLIAQLRVIRNINITEVLKERE